VGDVAVEDAQASADVGSEDPEGGPTDGADAGGDAEPAQPPELSVAEVIATADALLDQELIVSGRVDGDLTAKPGNWPDPAQSAFILRDSGDGSAIGLADAGVQYLRLYATSMDLEPYLREDVAVRGYLRRISFEASPDTDTIVELLYLEVVSVSVR
jgi:hypothetical protein